ncbi:MAG: protease SohB [Bdellovibrionales bacterium]
MDWTTLLTDVIGFLIKTGLIVTGILIVAVFFAWLGQMKAEQSSHLKVESWTDKFKEQKEVLQSFTLNKEEQKALKKELKKKIKSEEGKIKPNLFVLSFDGDIKASQAEALKNEVTAILSVAKPQDETLLVLNSPGGVVHGYGLAAAELVRFRDAQHPLTVCLDQIGASGGYMMACTAQKILASPFAIVGSIGVLSQVPNFHKLLKKNDIDYKEYTAGKHKTTVSLLAEITPEKEQKFQEMLEATHELFKNHIKKFRPQLDFDRVATGEYWYGTQALELGLIDGIQTSQQYLLQRAETHNILLIKSEKKKKLAEKLMGWLQTHFLPFSKESHQLWDQIRL